MIKGLLCTAFLTLPLSHYLTCPASAQGMVTDIKVLALDELSELEGQTAGYTGATKNDKKLDFRRGRGGGYVFAVSKTSTDTASYITSVRVEKRTAFGVEFDDGGKKYMPVPFWQSDKHKDTKYQGGLNGRNYSIYGGSYDGQPHVYVSRTGNTDFKNRVLKKVYVTTSKPKNTNDTVTCSGGHAGSGNYFVFEWHTHVPQFKPILDDEGRGDVTKHTRYCDTDQCGVAKDEPHTFAQLYGNDTWMQITRKGDKDTLSTKYHYKKCLDCGQIVYEAHKFATYSADWKNHNQVCLICDYIIEAEHANFGKEKIPVDQNYHVIFCDDCNFLKKLPHHYNTDLRKVIKRDCEHTVVRYKCKQCYHEAYFEEAGAGHQYNAQGICTREGCLHPYEQPGVEYSNNGSDSTFVIKTFGHLYWIADYVNNRRPKTNIRLANDLIAEDFVSVPWHPIGDADSTAFQGTFDGGDHVITMLQTEEPVAGCGYRGLFGTIAEGATVKNVSMAACNMRGWDYIGAVAGKNEGTIQGCHVVFSLMNSIGSGMNIGGICGLNKGTISGCSTEGSVWVGGVRDYAGGICGTNDGGTLSSNVTAAICGSGSDAVLPESASQQ